MGHSYCHCMMHCVFSTKGRKNLLFKDMRERLWPYIGGIARAHELKALAVGGIENHVHVLLSIPATIPVSKAVQVLKGNSSKWIKEEFPTLKDFAWQEGYGAFSVGMSQIDTTLRYIAEQERHHHRRTFEDEFLEFLKAHAMEYDQRYVFD